MDQHGTPRHSKGPTSKAEFEFGDEKEAYAYLQKRGRTDDQIAMLVSAGQMGIAVSKVMKQVKSNLWVIGERGPASKAEVDELPSETAFVRTPPSAMAAGLAPAVALAALGIELLDSARRLISAGKKLRLVFEENPQLEPTLNHWQFELQMFAAFSLHAARTEKLDPALSTKEMEAIALVVGFRPPHEEFGRETDLQEDNWRKMVEKVEAHILPALTTLELH